MIDKTNQKQETKQEPKSRFRDGSIFERWEEDEDDFLKCFSRKTKENTTEEN